MYIWINLPDFDNKFGKFRKMANFLKDDFVSFKKIQITSYFQPSLTNYRKMKELS